VECLELLFNILFRLFQEMLVHSLNQIYSVTGCDSLLDNLLKLKSDTGMLLIQVWRMT